MDQIANLVIDLGIDAAEFKNEIPRIKNLLNGAASDAERSSARMQRFMERQTQAARQTTQAASSAATAASVHAQTVEKNAQAHERMAREVEKTRQRMEALSQKMREEQAQAMALAEAQDKAAAAFYRQIDSVKQASAGLQELQRIQQQIRQARNSGGIGQQDYLALISEVTAKTRVLTQAEEEATRQKVAFIRQLKEQATRQNLSSSELLRAKAAQLGVSSAAEVYIRKMEQAGKATHSLGLKSAAARQEIGVLIGELARGNLGALRGSGITLANRAGWIDTLMSPKGMMLGGVIGGIAAAVYGLGKAWYDGQKEGEEFNRQLSLTGHYAGVTAGQLWTLSRAISGNGITQHAAAGALAQVVGSGAFRGNDIGMVARAAAQMERSVGQSVSDTINQFKRLKDDPVNAAKSLDNELHFLTATQLEQIRVLGEQGRSSDAARIAMSALAEETGRRTADIDNNLNALGSTLQTLSDWWKQFWDAAMNIGREDSLDAQIATLQEKVSRAKRLPWTASSSQVEYDQQRLNDLQEKKRQKDLQDAKEQAERNYQEQQKRRNAENAALNRMNETEAARHQREIARINAMQYADQAVRDAAIQRENERYEKALASGKKKTRETRNDEATRLLLQYSQQQAQVEGQIAAARQSAGIATDRMTEAHKQLLALQQRISDLDGKKLTADEKSVLARKIDLTEVGGERYFFCNEQNEKGEPVTWQGRQYQPYPIQGSGFELNGKGTSTRPTLTVSNLYGMVTGMAEDMQSLVGGTVVRRKVYARFLDAVNFVNGNSYADPEQEVISRWRIEQCSELSAVSASFVLSTPTETDGAVFPGRIMLANTCTWTYRGDECGYSGPAVADEYDQPTSDITKDKCSKCLSGCKFRNNVGNFGGFLSINKLSQ
ncbi:TPA: phage minor tail protein L [Escherichia coli]|nr:phage minor tail protein L [Escherichia coli]